MDNFRKGIFFALITALVSGISIFINSFAVQSFNESLFTTLKNLVVVVFLFSLILILGEFRHLKFLKARNWLQLAFIGLIGGSIPFLLFFNALSHTPAVNAGFIHKLMFLFVAVLAVIFLKEKLNRKVFAGSVLLVFAVTLLFGINVQAFNSFDLMILTATALWAAENVYSKHLLKEIQPKILAFGRMFFGSVFLLLFLAFTGKLALINSLTSIHFLWLLITSLFLFAYVLFWYSSLQKIPVSLATSILLLGLPVTALLNSLFTGKAIFPVPFIAYAVLAIGLYLLINCGEKEFFLKPKTVGVKKWLK
ncbi:MAG: DMT family transporter [Candidatus Diapherotrites archaeon]